MAFHVFDIAQPLTAPAFYPPTIDKKCFRVRSRPLSYSWMIGRSFLRELFAACGAPSSMVPCHSYLNFKHGCSAKSISRNVHRRFWPFYFRYHPKHYLIPRIVQLWPIKMFAGSVPPPSPRDAQPIAFVRIIPLRQPSDNAPSRSLFLPAPSADIF